MLTIYYDGDCPFCSAYTKLTELKSTVGEVALVNLREDSASQNRFQRSGLDLDQGMVVEFNGVVYHGKKAVNILALLSNGRGFLNKVSKVLLSNEILAALFYPILSVFRNITLFVLGREGLSDDNDGSESIRVVFCICLGIFSCLHLLVYATQYNVPLYWSTWCIPVVGVLLVFKPKDNRVFLLLVTIMAIDGVRQMPTLSNHTIIKNFLVVAILWSFVVCLRRANFRTLFSIFAPTGRCLLAVMYVFGVFHKINTGFLDPEVSCVVALWEKMPAVLSAIDHIYAYYVFIYGTLIIETIILLCLFFCKTRHWGILCGIAFHSILGVSGYAFYPPFSTLTIVLHLLFLTPGQAELLISSEAWKKSFDRLKSVEGVFLLIAWVCVIGWIAYYGDYSNAAVLWLIFPLLLMWVMFNCRLSSTEPLLGVGTFRSSSIVLNLIAILFLFNGLMPYMGLKSAQAMNMFANLQLENGLNNHLVMRHVEKPFGYLDDVVTVTESQYSEKLYYHRVANLPIVYHDLLAELSDNSKVVVSFKKDGLTYSDQNWKSLDNEIDRVVLPKWFRGYFHFGPVDLTEPKPCALDR